MRSSQGSNGKNEMSTYRNQHFTNIIRENSAENETSPGVVDKHQMMATFHSHDELVNGEDVIIGSNPNNKISPSKLANSNKVSHKNLDIKKI